MRLVTCSVLFLGVGTALTQADLGQAGDGVQAFRHPQAADQLPMSLSRTPTSYKWPMPVPGCCCTMQFPHPHSLRWIHFQPGR
jgi:hypothetical protein